MPTEVYERARMCALMGLHILNTEPEERFDKITRAAKERLKVPISTITTISDDKEWFKSVQGLKQKESPREVSFCGHALLNRGMFIVYDTLEDPDFMDNPLVLGDPYIRFYAGKALIEYDSNMPVGVFCIKDTKPRNLSGRELDIFLGFAEQAEKEINRNNRLRGLDETDGIEFNPETPDEPGALV